MAQQIIPGEEGMTLVEYIGGNSGDMTFYGPVTGLRYQLGGIRKVGNVDNRDLNTERNTGLLQINKNGHRLFQVYQPPAQAVQNVPETVLHERLATDVLKMKASDVVLVIQTSMGTGTLDKGQLEAMLEAEKEGKNRVSVIKAITDAIG